MRLVRLRKKQHFNKPLDIVRLRGGMPQENEWAKNTITTTCDYIYN